ncbi:hypothetical protein TNCV_2128381 [Trichonephila clavipes]|nr:hypothetical protein TNCV_2128381 [Trichonephila clavipes]
MKSIRFTGSVELSGIFTTRLTTAILNGCLQGFVIQGHPVRALSQRDKSPNLLKPMPCCTFIDSTIPKRLTYSGDFMQRLINPL